MCVCLEVPPTVDDELTQLEIYGVEVMDLKQDFIDLRSHLGKTVNSLFVPSYLVL